MNRKNPVSKRQKQRPGTSVDDVYRNLYKRIISGKYPPHFKMSQQVLAEEFNVSRTPLREALNRLQANGFLVADINRGMVVAPVQIAAAEAGYAARLLLEPPLASALVTKFDEKDLDEMEKALDAMERQWDRNADFQEAHLRFHQVGLRRYPKVIHDMVLSLYDQIHRHQRVHFSRPRIPNDFIDLDRAYLDSIRAGDEQKTRQILEFHLIDASIGMALDIESDYVPNALVLAAKAVGIEFEDLQGKILQRPIRIRWTRPDACRIPNLRTSNLICVDDMNDPLPGDHAKPEAIRPQI